MDLASDWNYQCHLYRNGGLQLVEKGAYWASIQLKEPNQKNAWYSFKSCQGTLGTSFPYESGWAGPFYCHGNATVHYDSLSNEDKNKKWCLKYDTTQQVCQFIEGSVESTWT